MIPNKFGRYELLERIGTSHAAEIFKARSIGAAGFEKIVAIKRIRPEHANDEAIVRRFTEEARVSASLTHASIVQVLEFGRVDDAHYLSMEYLNGACLRDVLKQHASAGSALPLPLAVHIGHAVAGALSYAQSRCDASGRPLNLLHLRVNPKNILLSFEGAVKLTGFGIGQARRARGERGDDEREQFAFTAPEELEGGEPDARSDVFSLGCVLYECALGQPAFREASDALTLDRVRQGAVMSPRDLRPDLDEEVEAILLRALARDPAHRFASAGELERAIEAFAQRSRLTFSAKQLARWMQANVRDAAKARPPAQSAARPDGDRPSRLPDVQRRPASRLGATRPGSALALPAIGRAVLATDSSPPTDLTRPPSGVAAPGGRAMTIKGHLAPGAELWADAVDSAASRRGIGDAATLPGQQQQLGGAQSYPQDATRTEPERTADLAEAHVDGEPSLTVHLTAADLAQVQVEELDEERADVEAVGHAATLEHQERHLSETGSVAHGLGGRAESDALASHDEQRLLREAEALQWDDGPTILDPREEQQPGKQGVGPAQLVLGGVEQAASQPDMVMPEFIVTEEGLDSPTRIEAVPASLLAEALGGSLTPATPARGVAAAELEAAFRGDGSSVGPSGATTGQLPEQPPREESPPRQARPTPPAPAEAQMTPPAPPAAEREGIGFLVPALAVVSLILLVAGAVLVYLLVTQRERRVLPRFETVPSVVEDEEGGLQTRSPPSASREQPSPERRSEGAAALTQRDSQVEGAQAVEARPDARPRRGEARNDARASETPRGGAGRPAGKERPKDRPNDRPSTAREKRPGPASARPPSTKQRARAATPPAGAGYGFLIVASQPKASVLVDGKNTGRTTPVRPSDPIVLSSGAHEVTLVANGHRFRYPVTITEQETTRLVRVLPVP